MQVRVRKRKVVVGLTSHTCATISIFPVSPATRQTYYYTYLFITGLSVRHRSLCHMMRDWLSNLHAPPSLPHGGSTMGG